MAKLQSLKLRKDDGERQIKCLIVEDYKTGDIVKYYDSDDFKDIIKDTDSMFLTKVYSPTQKEKEDLFKLVEGDIEVEDGYVSAEITEPDVVIGMFKRFTDLEIDLNDKELIEDVMSSPNDLFVAIKLEVDKILMSTFESYMSTYKTLQSNPQAQEMLSKTITLNEDAKKEDEIKKQKAEELKAQLRDLGVEV